MPTSPVLIWLYRDPSSGSVSGISTAVCRIVGLVKHAEKLARPAQLSPLSGPGPVADRSEVTEYGTRLMFSGDRDSSHLVLLELTMSSSNPCSMTACGDLPGGFLLAVLRLSDYIYVGSQHPR